MRVVYIADDGKEFNDEYDCEQYEKFTLNNRELHDIKFLNKDGNEVEEKFTDHSYSDTMQIIIGNESQLNPLHEYAKYCGFCAFEDINAVGAWKWTVEDGRWDGKFIKIAE